MRLFRCTTYGQMVFFENTTCLGCSGELVFDPSTLQITTTLPVQLGVEVGGRCTGCAPSCNWIATAPHRRCVSCSLTMTSPYAQGTVSQERWGRLELAKGRVLYDLLILGLPIVDLRFSSPESGITGHKNGLVTVVLSEAHDDERKRRRIDLHEPFRTLIGHFRHESDHFYFSRIPAGSFVQTRVRQLFGNEQADYAAAFQSYYRMGAQPSWENHFISGYASAHPSEDWAETWAHYLHISDALEVAWACGVALHPRATARAVLESIPETQRPQAALPTVDMSFATILAALLPISCFANSLNRSIGLQEWYPFVINPTVVQKLGLIHVLIPDLRPTDYLEPVLTAAA